MTDPEDGLPHPDDARLEALVDAITDGADVDWDLAESEAANSDERDLIRRLRLIAGFLQVGRGPSGDAASDERQPGDASVGLGPEHSTSESDIPTQDLLSSWGPLSIRAKVGSGSFGTVFRAWDPRLEREVALKLLRDVKSIGEVAAAAVIDEGRLLARIRHTNVVTVFGADYFEGKVGLWMEFIKGRTLHAILRERGPYSPEEAVIVGLDLCRALAAVHQAGFLHRDIKALNVMRESGGRIVLMDFGAAGVMKVSEFPNRILGTPLYMAPEVLMGDAPTVQSDLYSLGILLYHLVSGEFPVTGPSVDELRKGHSQRRRRLLRDVRPDLPSAFVRLVDDATADLADQRPESAGVMEALLESAAGRARQRTPATSATHQSAQPDPGQSIAVLPFTDLSPDRSLEYFCDGIAEEIINGLTGVPGVRVVAWVSAFRFKRRTEDVRQVGSALNVGTVLEGSVRASGNKLRIISRLIDTADGRQIWSEQFERNLGDIFAVQDEIARAAVGALRVRAGGEMLSAIAIPSTPTTRDFEAYTLYLKGRHYWNKRTEAALHKGAAYFQEAVERDPNYAEGFAGLAEAYATLGLYGVLAPHEVMPRAKAAAQHAIKIVDTLPSPFATSACVASVYDWQWREAEHDYRRAIDLNPKHPAAHHWYAINYLVPLKRFEEADRELRCAVDVDPLSMPIRVSVGLRFYFAHQYVEAQHELRNSFELDSGSPIARLFLGLTLVEMGSYDEAVRELETAIQLSPSPEMTAALGYAWARAGNTDRARQALGELVNMSGQRYLSPSLIAQVNVGLGDTLASLEWLEKAVDIRAADLAWLAVRPVFDPLRLEARFNALLERLGL